jgi:hypothetical protein
VKFHEWLKKVNVEIHRITGLHRNDFGDTISLQDRFSDECEPLEVAIEILENDDAGINFLELYEGNVV